MLEIKRKMKVMCKNDDDREVVPPKNKALVNHQPLFSIFKRYFAIWLHFAIWKIAGLLAYTCVLYLVRTVLNECPPKN